MTDSVDVTFKLYYSVAPLFYQVSRMTIFHMWTILLYPNGVFPRVLFQVIRYPVLMKTIDSCISKFLCRYNTCFTTSCAHFQSLYAYICMIYISDVIHVSFFCFSTWKSTVLTTCLNFFQYIPPKLLKCFRKQQTPFLSTVQKWFNFSVHCW